MDAYEAWRWIIEHWNCSVWTPIPREIAALTVGANPGKPRMGMCRGACVTLPGSQGMTIFINNMNAPRN